MPQEYAGFCYCRVGTRRLTYDRDQFLERLSARSAQKKPGAAALKVNVLHRVIAVARHLLDLLFTGILGSPLLLLMNCPFPPSTTVKIYSLPVLMLFSQTLVKWPLIFLLSLFLNILLMRLKPYESGP